MTLLIALISIPARVANACPNDKRELRVISEGQIVDHTDLSVRGRPEKWAVIKDCYAYARFADGSIHLLDVATSKTCEAVALWSLKDALDPRQELDTNGQLPNLLPQLDRSNEKSRIWFLRKVEGNVIFAKKGPSEGTMWLKGATEHDIPVTLTEAYVQQQTAEAVSKLLFKSQNVQSIDYLGDRAPSRAFPLQLQKSFTSYNSALDPKPICYAAALEKLRKLLYERVDQYADGNDLEDKLFRALVLFGRKTLDPIAFSL